MLDTVIEIVGFIMLWMATDVGRNEESKIKIFSSNWWLILVLIAFGALLANGGGQNLF
jgi:hypothetical protein